MTLTVPALQNVVVVGGSYVGLSAAQQIAALLPATHRVVLVEPHSHFHHLFAFPRFAVLAGHEHKAFIPYTSTFPSAPSAPYPSAAHVVATARATAVHAHSLTLDTPFEGSHILPFAFLALATGTRLRAPGNVPRAREAAKASAIAYFQTVQARVAAAADVLVVGGGAVGVQLACDAKELFPAKRVRVLARVLMRTYPGLHEIVRRRFGELGVEVVEGRAVIPENGWGEGDGEGEGEGEGDGEEKQRKRQVVLLEDGRRLEAGVVVCATGQTPNSDLIRTLPGSHLTPTNFIAVRPTLQLADPAFPHIFALGDVAASGAHKAARPGIAQAAAVAANIAAMLSGKRASEEIVVNPAGIHMTLGITKNIVFRNPAPGEEATVKWRDDGTPDMNIDAIWTRRGVRVNCADDYRL